MYRSITLILAALAASSKASAASVKGDRWSPLQSRASSNTSVPIYKDPSHCVDDRVEDLLSRMTLEEKAGQMFHMHMRVGANYTVDPGNYDPEAPRNWNSTENMVVDKHMTHFNLLGELGNARQGAEWFNRIQEIAMNTRLGIPITLSTDPRHHQANTIGASVSPGAFTLWPESLGLAALRDPQIVYQMADTAREEYVAVGLRAALHPQVDLATEPRWARIFNSWSEDAHLTAEMIVPYIKGFQGDTIGPHSVTTVTKHFPGGGSVMDGHDTHFAYGKNATFPGNNLDYHLIPFRAAFEAGARQIMPYYSRPIGTEFEEVGFAFNRQIVTELLREKMGFDGIVVSDWGLITDVVTGGYPFPARAWGMEDQSDENRAFRIVDAGCDQLGGEERPELLVELVREGRLTEERIDLSVRKLLKEKFLLGLFESPYVDPDAAERIVGNEYFKRLADSAQRRSYTLLTNKYDILPLRNLANGTKIYVENVNKTLIEARGYVAVETPEQADIALMRLSPPYDPMNGTLTGFMGFRTGTLEYYENEKARQAAVYNTVPHAIVDIYTNRPIAIPEVVEQTSAVFASYGATDEAFLDVVFGDAEPEGKLPFDLLRSNEAAEVQMEDVPFDTRDPVFKFGHGLRYRDLPAAANEAILGAIANLTNLVEKQSEQLDRHCCGPSHAPIHAAEGQPDDTLPQLQPANAADGLLNEPSLAGHITESKLQAQGAETVLEWDILAPYRTNDCLFATTGQPHEDFDSLSPPVLRRDEMLRLESRYIQGVHTKNPFLKLPELRAKILDVAENGPGWSTKTCLVALVCAIGAATQPVGETNLARDAESPAAEAQCLTGPSELDLSFQYWGIATKRIGIAIGRNEIEAVQCLCLAGIWHMHMFRPIEAWRFFHLAGAAWHGLKLMDQQLHQPHDVVATPSKSLSSMQALHFTIWKSQCELLMELPLPSTDLDDSLFPHGFPNPPTAETSDPTYIITDHERTWWYYLAEIAARHLLNRIARTDRVVPRLVTTDHVRKMLRQADIMEMQIHNWYLSLPSLFRFRIPTGLDLEHNSDDLTLILRHRYLGLREYVGRPFVRLCVEFALEDIEPAVRAKVVSLASQSVEYTMSSDFQGSNWTTFLLTVTGFVAILTTIVRVVLYFLPFLQSSQLHRYHHVSKDGQTSWALVTGASDGIGREFARALAKQGFNVVLHGRNAAKLSNVESGLSKDFPNCSFKTLVADASAVCCTNCTSKASHGVDFEAITKQVADLHLTVLINNAGGGLQDPTFACAYTESEHRLLANTSLNALFPALLIRALLPTLIQNSPSLIMNISSLADSGFPLIAFYSSSKSFLMTLTRSLRLEMAMEEHDVEVLGVRIGKTTMASGFTEAPKPFLPSSRAMAKAALDRVGSSHAIVVGYWQHALQDFFLGLMPEWVQNKLMISAINSQSAYHLHRVKRS
ncbi:putative beta-glucosidase C [Paramyrothecium foliicola]|nr:putative beta-glucosidase C [Paramyrothecium foliicola]